MDNRFYSLNKLRKKCYSAVCFETIDNVGPDDEEGLTLPFIVLNSAPWCGVCHLTCPIVKDVMKQYCSRIEVVKSSTDHLSDAVLISLGAKHSHNFNISQG